MREFLLNSRSLGFARDDEHMNLFFLILFIRNSSASSTRRPLLQRGRRNSHKKYPPENIREAYSPVGRVNQTVNEHGYHNCSEREKEVVTFFFHVLKHIPKPPKNQKTTSQKSNDPASEPKGEEYIVRLGDRPLEVGREIFLIGEIACLEVPRTNAENGRVHNHFSGRLPYHHTRSKR